MYNKFFKNFIALGTVMLVCMMWSGDKDVWRDVDYVTYYPDEYDVVLNNPYMGFAPNAQWNHAQSHRLVINFYMESPCLRPIIMIPRAIRIPPHHCSNPTLSLSIVKDNIKAVKGIRPE